MRPRPRATGWTAERRRTFVEALAEWGSVRAACDYVGLSPAAAYALRARPDAEQFRVAWNLAVEASHTRLVDLAMNRAREGTARTVFHKGQPIGEQRVYSDRLLIHMLNRYDRSRAAQVAANQRDPGVRTANDSLAMALAALDRDCEREAKETRE